MRHFYQKEFPEYSDKLKFYIGDVRDIQSVRNAMHGVDYIFHAAALKQVPSCEFFPVEAVVFSAAEMGYQLAFQRLEILVGNFIEQVADSPRDMYLLCRLKIGALAAILWNTQWIDDADGRVLGGIAKGG